uniref:Uncharacterized protein n=1 Tax=Lepeophtheirus salmonis TaxID=72036 RepID=A0A0K2SVK9_LEPSM
MTCANFHCRTISSSGSTSRRKFERSPKLLILLIQMKAQH